MSLTNADIGVIGLGVMGRNLALNIADHDFSVFGLDYNAEKVELLKTEHDGKQVDGSTSLDTMLQSLKKPRVILLLIPAGKPVDESIGELKNKLDTGDIIIDGGNSHFTDSNRHIHELAENQIHFIGMGVSGGEEGARRGPSMMPGGTEEAYQRIRPIVEAASAKVNGEPCVTYLGPGSAGHYVKMVHNGIEYALMQLLAESYDILKRVGGLSNDEMADVYEKWNSGPLGSFLVEITSQILRVNDSQTNQRLVDMILDAAKQKGTGKWTSQDAMELQVPVPTIDAAVSMRDMSGYKPEREEAAKIFPISNTTSSIDKKNLISDLTDTMHFAMIASYAQGMSLLLAASKKYEYNLNLADIAKIWRGGCIIRAKMLEDIRHIFVVNPDTPNLMVQDPFMKILESNRTSLVNILKLAFDHEIPVPGLASVLGYFDGYHTFQLPANLIQAQRDYFGSHTYERIDSDGTFHSKWQVR